MHKGNLSLATEDGWPYALAPAYDMLPMGFAPLSGGGLRDKLSAVNLHASVKSAVWVQALGLAANFLGCVRAEGRFFEAFRLTLVCRPGISMTRAQVTPWLRRAAEWRYRATAVSAQPLQY